MRRLAEVAIGERVVLEACELSAELAQWVSAIGLSEGEEIVVLERGLAGGPLHVRTTSGLELAVGRDVARAIRVRSA